MHVFLNFVIDFSVLLGKCKVCFAFSQCPQAFFVNVLANLLIFAKKKRRKPVKEDLFLKPDLTFFSVEIITLA